MYMELPRAAEICIAVALVCIGACMGRIVSRAAARYAMKRGAAGENGCCRACGKPYGILAHIPVLGFLFSGGRCPKCGAALPLRGFFTELLSGLTYLAVFLRYGFGFITLEYLILFSVLIAVALIDCDTMEIPDGLTLFCVCLFPVFLYPHGGYEERLKDGLLGAAVFGGGTLLLSLLITLVSKRETLGGGDIKLLAMLGLYTGLARGLLLLLLACVLGLLLSLALKNGKRREFPFGPAIVISAVFTLLVGQEIVGPFFSLFL